MAADNLIREIIESLNRIKENPNIRPLVQDKHLASLGYRSINVKNYIIFYIKAQVVDMKKLIHEDYRFIITVIDGYRNKDGVIDCRNGHEIGDTYICEYGCPDGFCSKSMMKMFPLMEAVRAGGDLRNLRSNAEQLSCDFTCADGCVRFQLRAERIS